MRPMRKGQPDGHKLSTAHSRSSRVSGQPAWEVHQSIPAHRTHTSEGVDLDVVGLEVLEVRVKVPRDLRVQPPWGEQWGV